MQRRLFGTDGIRGVANRHPMTPEIALKLGKAVAQAFSNGRQPQVVVGKDTRLSGYLFENALTAGLVAAGAKVFLVGPLPTPAIAHITRSFAADAGIVISASHNPAEHNGIKLFSGDGFKLPDEKEAEIEQLMEASPQEGEAIGKARRIEDARGRYIEYAKGTINNESLAGLKIVLDCANGAAYSVAPVILKELGAEVITLNNEPDGLNINENCGATHPELIAENVKKHNADIGIALDGDADRVIMVDEEGAIVDGDHIIALLALDLKRHGKLAQNSVVVTDYTNKGFDAAMKEHGITVHRVQNGDRYVIEKLRKDGFNLGGEQSGHIILFDYITTGDGMITTLHVLHIMRENKQKLSALKSCMASWPQLLENVKVKEKRPLQDLAQVHAAITAAEQELGEEGRVLVRYSGTEALARVMVEGKDKEKISAFTQQIVTALKQEVGQ